MSYRPKNWVNPHEPRILSNPRSIQECGKRQRDYEAGADALLEALKAEGLEIKVDEENTIDDISVMAWLDDKLDKTPEGTLVFIPKEQVK